MATMFNQQPFFNVSGHRTQSNQTKMKLQCVQRLAIKSSWWSDHHLGGWGMEKRWIPSPLSLTFVPIKHFYLKFNQ